MDPPQAKRRQCNLFEFGLRKLPPGSNLEERAGFTGPRLAPEVREAQLQRLESEALSRRESIVRNAEAAGDARLAAASGSTARPVGRPLKHHNGCALLPAS